MFIIIATYRKPLEDVERVLPAHLAYLERQYEQGRFFCWGPQVPRTGGVILAKADSRAELEKILAADPFAAEGIADYTITEFTPRKAAPALGELLGG